MTEQTVETPTEDTAPEVVEVVAQTTDETETEATTEEEPETFPREYVVKLRDENARYRTRAQQADDLAHRLHAALTAATGRLADPSDLTFDDAHLDDADALNAAIDDLLARKPHLASRRPAGDVGQGVSGPTESVDLAGILRARAS